jgi:hypothetical protein
VRLVQMEPMARKVCLVQMAPKVRRVVLVWMALTVQLERSAPRVPLVQMVVMGHKALLVRKGQREYEGQLVHKAKQVLKVQLAKEVQGHSQT